MTEVESRMVAIAVERGQGDTHHASSQVQLIFRNRAPSRLMRRLYFRDDAKTACVPRRSPRRWKPLDNHSPQKQHRPLQLQGAMLPSLNVLYVTRPRVVRCRPRSRNMLTDTRPTRRAGSRDHSHPRCRCCRNPPRPRCPRWTRAWRDRLLQSTRCRRDRWRS